MSPWFWAITLLCHTGFLVLLTIHLFSTTGPLLCLLLFLNTDLVYIWIHSSSKFLFKDFCRETGPAHTLPGGSLPHSHCLCYITSCHFTSSSAPVAIINYCNSYVFTLYSLFQQGEPSVLFPFASPVRTGVFVKLLLNEWMHEQMNEWLTEAQVRWEEKWNRKPLTC